MYTNKIASLSELPSALVLLVDPLQTVSAALLDDPSLREDVDEVLGLNLGEVVMTLAVLFIRQRLRVPKMRTCEVASSADAASSEENRKSEVVKIRKETTIPKMNCTPPFRATVSALFERCRPASCS